MWHPVAGPSGAHARPRDGPDVPAARLGRRAVAREARADRTHRIVGEHAAPVDPAGHGVQRVTGRGLRHGAAVLGGFTLVFCWVFARPLLEGTYLSESDLYDYYLPVFLAPPAVWSSFEFAGMPAFADPENSTFYLLHLLFARVIGSWTGFIISAYVLGACFMYAYVYHHTRSAGAATLSGLAYGLSEAMLERMAHPSIVHVLAWLPLLVLSLDHLRLARRRWAWAGIGAVAAANCVLAGHPQVPVYIAYVGGAYALAGVLADRWNRASLAAAAVMGAGAAMLGAVVLLPLEEVSRYMARQEIAFEEFVSYSNTPAEMLSVVFPSITHIGREAPTYVGLGVLMLAPVGVWCTSNWRAGFWAIVAAAALLLGAGDATPLARLAYELPVYDRFRIVARHLIFAAFALTALAGFGLAAIDQGRASRRAVAVSIAGVLLTMTGAGLMLAWWPQAFGFERVNDAQSLPLWNSGIWFQFGVAVGVAAVCLALSRHRSRVWIVVLMAVVGWDLARAFPGDMGPRGLAVETIPAAALGPSVHASRLKAALERDHQRLFTPGGAQTNDIVPAMFARLWQIPTTGGNSSVVIDSMATLAMLPQLRSGDRAVLGEANAALDMLAVRYVVFRTAAMTSEERALLSDAGRWREAERVSTSRVSDRAADDDVPGETEYVVFENRRALPRAWLAREVLPLTDGGLVDAAHGSRLRDGRRFDPAQMALVDEGQLPPRVYPDGTRDVRVESVEDGLVRVRVSSEQGGFLVLSEAYYPGWRARIGDDPPQPVHRTGIALQGIEVPAGDHLVVFEFVSDTRRVGAAVSGLGVLVVLGLVLYGAVARGPRPGPSPHVTPS